MKALSIRQPWAWAILYAGKTVENRSRSISYRGQLAIHASKTIDDAGISWLLAHGFTLPPQFQTGGIIGSVRIVGVVSEADRHLMSSHDREWFTGPIGYVLDSPESCAFVPWRGRLGFFDVPDDLVRIAA
jgi:hypothetical protein